MLDKVVKIINTTSIAELYLGRYGIVTEKSYADRWDIEFKARVGTFGSSAHAVSGFDFEVVGKIEKEPIKTNLRQFIEIEADKLIKANIDFAEALKEFIKEGANKC